MIRIKETIHHGEYRSKRFVEVHAINELTVRGILMSSPYPSTNPNQTRLEAMIANLKEQGKAQHGWADYEIVEED